MREGRKIFPSLPDWNEMRLLAPDHSGLADGYVPSGEKYVATERTNLELKKNYFNERIRNDIDLLDNGHYNLITHVSIS